MKLLFTLGDGALFHLKKASSPMSSREELYSPLWYIPKTAIGWSYEAWIMKM